MRFNFYLILLLTAALSALAAPQSEDPLVFISSFMPGKDGAIYTARLNLKTGQLTNINRAADVENSYYMTLSPNKNFLYAIHAKEFGSKDNEQVAAFALVGQTGQLKPLNRESTLGSASCYLHVESTGKTLLLANYMGGSVASLPIREDGSLGKAVSFIRHTGPAGGPEPQDSPHAHCILATPDNRFACATDLGLDQVMVCRLDAANTKLSALDKPARTPKGAGPRHMVFHPNGKSLYTINELGGSITCFNYDPPSAALTERQTISTLPKDFQGKNACADVKITPNGRFLYGTNRGHDSIACYRVAPDGQLSLIDIKQSLGKEPQNLAITPGGEWLLCANMTGNRVTVFRIDPNTGNLTSIGAPASVPSPSCIQLLF